MPVGGGGLAAAAVAAVAVVVVAVVVVAFVTTAAASVVLGLKLFGRGITHELHVTSIAHGLSGQLVVEVHEHLVVGYFHDLSLDAHVLLGHHGHESARADVFVIELAIDVEDFFLQLINQFGVFVSKGLMGLQGEVKFVSLLQSHDAVLETLDE